MVLEDAHALAIGISRYQHVAPLRETEDALQIATTLRDPAHGCYPPSAVELLIDDQATRAAICSALDTLARTTRASSTVFVYFSGHGARSRVDAAYYLLPVDAVSKDLPRTAISSDELSAKLRAIPAGRLTVVLDCCRAAELAEPELVDPELASGELSGELVAPLARGRGRVVLAATRASGNAYAMPGAQTSTFTGYLLAGLRGAAPAAGGVIRVCDLFHYVQQKVAGDQALQHPVFKAELEENYPIAYLRGGAAEPPVVPAPPDTLPYDAFLSYRHDDPTDRAWVTERVVPYLEDAGLRVCLAHRDFRLGAPRLQEIERAVTRSRYTVAVFTPAYTAGAYEELQWLLAAHATVEARAPRLIPLLRRPCQLTLYARMTELLDVTDDAGVPAALARLALALREPPRPRLSE